MKLLAPLVSLLLGLVLCPVLLTSGDPPPPAVCGVAAGPTSVILATIRTMESGGDYQARAVGSSASGAYQIIDGTWFGFGGYARASDAPPEVQDAKAAEMVNLVLGKHDGDLSAVPVVWYIGRVPAFDSPDWDTVPLPQVGNTLTPREYQTRWLAKYRELLAESPSGQTGSNPAGEPTPAPGSCFGGSVTPTESGLAFPGPVALAAANPAVLSYPHHDYPAWDWMIPLNTPIYAVHAGQVAVIRTWPHNWWSEGCGTTDGGGCDTCGVGLTIVDANGTRWTYCHGTNLTVQIGNEVPAGRQVMWSGNTGRSGGPHLHLEIRTADGVQRCPQPLLAALSQSSVAPATSSLPASGCQF